MFKTFKITVLSALALFAAGAAPAAAKVDVVAATQDLAWVVRAVGGTEVSVDYLAASSQDPHQIDPRPSQVVKLARADMVVRHGMDLDLWFDSLLRAAGNSAILPTGRGYVDASRGIRALEMPAGKLDPSRGDIHVYGNPHYMSGPSNVRVVAGNVRDGLKRADPGHAASYDNNYTTLMNRLNAAIQGWRAKLAPHRGKSVVPYHKSLAYLLSEFGLREFGTVEPRPGLTPTAGHVNGLAGRMKADGASVILMESYRSRRWADLLAKQSGGKVVVIPGGVGGERGTDDYFAYMNAVVDRLSQAL